jgi:hypothetical protein
MCHENLNLLILHGFSLSLLFNVVYGVFNTFFMPIVTWYELT